MHRHLRQVLQTTRVRPPTHHQVRSGEPELANTLALDAGHPCSDLAQIRRHSGADQRDATTDRGRYRKAARPVRPGIQDSEEASAGAPEVLPKRI